MTDPRDNRSLQVVEDEPLVLSKQRKLLEKASEYVRAGRASNTRRAYESGMRIYKDWCEEMGLDAAPNPTQVALFATMLAENGRAWSTINVALSAIDYSLKLQGLDPLRSSREVSEVCEGIRRVHGVQQRRALPILVDTLRKMVEALDGPSATRDKALLLLGFTGAFRRSEIVALDVGDLQREENGYVVTLRRSKTDQTGAGTMKGIPYGGRASTCPVRALDAWLQRKETHAEGDPLFVSFSPCCPREGNRLSDQAVSRIVKRGLQAARLDAKGHSGHSLRAGFVTAAAKAGKRLDLIMLQTGHKSVETVMRYVRHADLFAENAAEGLGL